MRLVKYSVSVCGSWRQRIQSKCRPRIEVSASGRVRDLRIPQESLKTSVLRPQSMDEAWYGPLRGPPPGVLHTEDGAVSVFGYRNAQGCRFSSRIRVTPWQAHAHVIDSMMWIEERPSHVRVEDYARGARDVNRDLTDLIHKVAKVTGSTDVLTERGPAVAHFVLAGSDVGMYAATILPQFYEELSRDS